jgi:hypothetical protein
MIQHVDHALTTNEQLSCVEEHVRTRLGGLVQNLRLIVRDDGLVLRGYARTYYAKQMAQHAVMETISLPIQANEIEVC